MKKQLFINIALSILSAVLLILSSAGFGFSWLVFIAFVPILYAVKSGGLKPVFSGWIMGFLYWVVCLSWMTTTFSYFGGAPLIASLGLLLFIAISGGFFFFAPFTYIAGKYSNPMLLGIVFIALEALKGTFFFGGVPWLNLAQSQYQNTLILQFVSWFGEYGLSFIIMVINVLIFKIAAKERIRLNVALLAATVIFMITPGLFRLISPIEYSVMKNITVIQPGYKQEIKWKQDQRLAIVNNLNARLLAAAKAKPDLIILPETSYPASLLDSPMIMDVIMDAAKSSTIIAGTDRKITDEKGNVKDYYNSMILIKKDGGIQLYDKMHLTPFGEYFPFENLLKPMKEFFFGPGKMFSPGTRPTLLVTEDFKIAPLICFESGFSELLKGPIAMGANIIVVISNDTWFGKNQGRVQHLAVNAVRAAEYGKSTAVATQDGISAVIMPDGSIPEMVIKQEPAEINFALPLVEGKTIYSHIRYIWIAFIIAVVYYCVRKKRKGQS